MQIKNIKSYEHYFEKYGIILLRTGVMVFLVINFHWLNGYPFQIDPINLAELSYLLSIVVLFFLTIGHKLPIESRWQKLVFDFCFATLFVGLSLGQMGAHSGLYVLYLIPIIYCSYWFSKVATVSFVTAVSVIYCFSNYFMLGMNTEFKSIKGVVKVLGPMVVIFYVVAIGGIYYKKKSQRSAVLCREKDYTRSLLKSSFDAIIAVDENGKVTEANMQACELLGCELKDIALQKVKNFYAPGEAVKVMEKLKESSDGSIENFNTLISSVKGEKIPILLSASFLYDKELDFKKELAKGRKFPTVGYFRDKRVEDVVDNISKDIASISDEKKLLDKIAQTVADTLHAEACSILTYNENSGSLDLITSYGLPASLTTGSKFETYGNENDGMTGKVFFLTQSLNIPDIDVSRKQPEYINIKYAENFEKNSRYGKYKHFLGVPLVVQGEVYGVIRVLNKYCSDIELDKQGFTDNDQKVLERISNQVSFLIEKARGKGRFNAILKVGQDLNQMLDISLDELLETITKEVVIGMRFKACYLRMVEDGDKLKIRACYGLKGDYRNQDKYIIPIGHGICGEVARTGIYSAIEDLEKANNFEFRELIESEGLRAMLSIPMKYRERIIGVINCYTCRFHKFTEQEIQIMNTFAAYVSIAIQNKKRVDELYAINVVGNELLKPINIDNLFDLILEKAKLLSGVDGFCLKLYDERFGLLKTKRASNCRWFETCSENPIDVKHGLGAEVLGEVIDKGQSLIIPDFGPIWEKMDDVPQKELFKDVKSCAIIPITIDKKVYGVLFLDKYYKCNFFVEDDLLVLKAFSNQAAIAIRNVNFFNKLQRVTETYPRISELNVDIDKVLENISKIAAEVLETDILVLYRYDEKNKKIIYPPIYEGEIIYPEHMKKEVGENDTPYLLLKGGQNLYAENSQEDLIMTPTRNPMEGIPERFVVREKIASSAGILLKVGQDIVGIMFINYRSTHNFDEDERKIIDNYASYIAIAIQNVKHFGEKEISSALQTLGRLAAVVAHKINTDIGTINLYAGDLMDDIDKKNPHFHNVSQIKKQVHKITMDIDFLMNASKLKYPEKETSNIIDIVNAIDREMTIELKEKNIKLEKNVIGSLPKIKIDVIQIKMVFSNLIYNSIAAMPGGGKIIISISTVENEMLLEWQDTGCGISPEYAWKLFQPLWTTKNRGFGLGLFLSKAIIEEHGGSIALDANHKGGAKFIIKFPIKE